jgi:phage recombination protein Bet
MSTEIVKKSSEISFTNEQIEIIKKTIAKDATPLEFELFMNIAKSAGLNPFHRQVFFVRRGGIGQTTASIDGLRLIAHRTGEYRGQVGPLWCGEDGKWQDVWTSSTPPVAAKVGVWRVGFSEPLYSVANFQAYCANTPIWKKMPELMISKCAESLALRRAFPLEMSGLYSNEELEHDLSGDAIPTTVSQAQIEDAPAIYKGNDADKKWLIAELATFGIKNDKSEEYAKCAGDWHKWSLNKSYDEVLKKLNEDLKGS